MRERIKKVLMGLMIMGLAFGFLSGCGNNDQATGNKAVNDKAISDNKAANDKAIEEVAGSQASKQYQATKDQLNAIGEKQKENFKTIPGDEAQGSK